MLKRSQLYLKIRNYCSKIPYRLKLTKEIKYIIIFLLNKIKV